MLGTFIAATWCSHGAITSAITSGSYRAAAVRPEPGEEGGFEGLVCLQTYIAEQRARISQERDKVI